MSTPSIIIINIIIIIYKLNYQVKFCHLEIKAKKLNEIWKQWKYDIIVWFIKLFIFTLLILVHVQYYTYKHTHLYMSALSFVFNLKGVFLFVKPGQNLVIRFPKNHSIWIFLLLNAINTFYSLYYDYCKLITKFWAGSTKWNTPLIINFVYGFVIDAKYSFIENKHLFF